MASIFKNIKIDITLMLDSLELPTQYIMIRAYSDLFSHYAILNKEEVLFYDDLLEGIILTCNPF